MNYKVVGIDLAKSIFQVCALNQNNTVVFNKKVSRKNLTALVQQLPPTRIAMEACGSANYWARIFQHMGHEVQLIPAQHVKPFVQGQKNDHNDALAICEAALRPSIHSVAVKSIEQQDIQMVHRIRQRHIRNRTAIANQIRALLRENGIVIGISLPKLCKEVPFILDKGENHLSALSLQLLSGLYDELVREKDQVLQLECILKQYIKLNEDCQRLMSIPGYGPIAASALVSAIGNGTQFKNGRQLSAWMGLVPKHMASGGKVKVLDTTKAGNLYLRYLLIHGARTVVNWSSRKSDPLSRWIQRIVQRRGYQKAIVALANKNARIAWVVLSKKQSFNMNYSKVQTS